MDAGGRAVILTRLPVDVDVVLEVEEEADKDIEEELDIPGVVVGGAVDAVRLTAAMNDDALREVGCTRGGFVEGKPQEAYGG